MITRLSPDIANFASLQEFDVSHNGNNMQLLSCIVLHFVICAFCVRG